MEFGLSSEDRVIEGMNALLAKNAQLGISGGQGEHWNMLTGFDWANMDGWPDPGQITSRASVSY
jgi:hypothetical protein